MAGLISDPTVVTAALAVMAEAGRPIGARVLNDGLARRGVHLSEPTAARLLQEFDRLGYTRNQGHSGRQLTELGRNELAHREHYQDRDRTTRQFLETLRSSTLQDIVNVLNAQRALKREMGRLATMNATSRDRAALSAEMQKMRETGMPHGSHKLIARAAHNPVLESLFELVADHPGLAELVHRLVVERGHQRIVSYHARAIEAIEHGDSKGIQAITDEHYDELTAQIEQLWKALRPKSSRRPHSAQHPAARRADRRSR